MKKPKIVIVGIGSSGISTVNTMSENKLIHQDLETIAISLDNSTLDEIKVDHKIKLHSTLPDGVLGYDKSTMVKYLSGKSKEEIQAMRKEAYSQRVSDMNNDIVYNSEDYIVHEAIKKETELKTISTEYFYYDGISKNGTELNYTDRELYKNIDKVLQTPKLTTIIIKFTNIAVEEGVFLKLSQNKALVNLKLSFINTDISVLPYGIFGITSLTTLHIDNINIEELSSDIGKLINLLIFCI